MKVILPRRGETNSPPPPREKFFTIGIFKKNTSKYAKLMFELYICDNLNQIYRFLSLLTKNDLK